MITLNTNNIALKYEDGTWSEKRSKKVSTVEAVLVSTSTLTSIAIFVGVVRIADQFGHVGIGMFIGLIAMMLSMICLIALSEKVTYGKEIAGFRFLDWFYISPDAKAVYNMGDVSIERTVGKVVESHKLEQILRSFGCAYKMNYTDRYRLSKETPIEVCIDATNKDTVSVNVERVEVE